MGIILFNSGEDKIKKLKLIDKAITWTRASTCNN